MPCYQSTRYTRNFTIRKCSDGTPVDVTGWEFRSQIRDNRDDPNYLVELTTANGGWLVMNGLGGRIQFTLSPNQTLLLPLSRVMMDVERTDLVGEGPIWLFEATFQVRKPITRDFP